ncbi:RNA guanine-N7 methyltransferase activating subunit [Petromyzon marinus]|uniref:RNA guanine-N7 methyltransferase activating subunit n=1 Tax=Petromyzon marinus TaxID=7757 RepID=A0AAJ7U9W8_PETMA|nr:RNA guanine-N7 methyltransferase activating subunit [Petromyzon marinus]XP_032831837.1 RNA guanine-N7 methyltransferase activating subunit [Petromyzon marinus]XP_032831838.1 RNA guanine-N7 methyltransferase activating subunit [Petromyzon marinus]XP_032831839.1 RNA guanine-N7 methyltransferase activating subunit [Petromyzon marinus]XP_032831840.1 RNA guanine-N7 methyltransferase activating subunit [Petromyzon marinus]XP_032831841.1 RNA guanine-N7 methyltransferase activating subunit [Petromy
MSNSPSTNVAEQRSSASKTEMEAAKEVIQGEEEEEEQVERSEEAEKENKEEEEEGDAGCDDDYNRLFARRFTAEDKDFQEFFSRPAELPPVVWNWRPRGGRNDRRFDRRDRDGRRGEGSDGGWGRHGEGGRGSYHRDDRFNPYRRSNPHPYR